MTFWLCLCAGCHRSLPDLMKSRFQGTCSPLLMLVSHVCITFPCESLQKIWHHNFEEKWWATTPPPPLSPTPEAFVQLLTCSRMGQAHEAVRTDKISSKPCRVGCFHACCQQMLQMFVFFLHTWVWRFSLSWVWFSTCSAFRGFCWVPLLLCGSRLVLHCCKRFLLYPYCTSWLRSCHYVLLKRFLLYLHSALWPCSSTTMSYCTCGIGLVPLCVKRCLLMHHMYSVVLLFQ